MTTVRWVGASTFLLPVLLLAAPLQAQRQERAGVSAETRRANAPVAVAGQPVAGRKSGFIAFGLAYLFPGLGHFYVGDTHRGVTILGIVAGGAMLAVSEAERSPGTAVVALSGAYLVYLWSMVDAPLASRRHNRALDRQAAGTRMLP